MEIKYIHYLRSVKALILLLFIVSFNTNNFAQSCLDGTYSYDDDILPIIMANCAPCHTTASSGGWNAISYAGILSAGNNCGPAVVPGFSGASSILELTAFGAGVGPATSCSQNMPQFTGFGAGISLADYMAIQDWIDQGAQEFCTFTPIAGCIDAAACNFNSYANQDDGSCDFIGDPCDDLNANTINDVLNLACICEGILPEIQGCTDPLACNFNINANVNDNSCLGVGDPCDDGLPNTTNDAYDSDCICVGLATGYILGCTDISACNYNSAATADDGSCTTVDCLGICGGVDTIGAVCDDGDPTTILDTYNGFCTCVGFVGVLGCTDQTACNYNALATVDNAMCSFETDCNGVCGGVDTVGAICDDLNALTTNDVFDTDCYCVGELAIPGCTDPLACNYLTYATVDDSTCVYGNLFCDDPCNDVIGCTNPIAVNFNANANCDDGTCNILGCTNINACNFNPLANQDDGTCASDITISFVNNPDPPSLTSEIILTITGGIPDLLASTEVYTITGDFNGTATAGNPFIADANFQCGSTFSVLVEDSICSNILSFTVDCSIAGCTDALACNYVPAATIEDSTCLYLDCIGICGGTDTIGAICDDGSIFTTNDLYNASCNCIGVTIPGCTDNTACNYNPAATLDDASCLFDDCFGICGGSNVPGATCDDGDPTTNYDVYDSFCNCAGVTIPIFGCINPDACNYDPTVNVDDGTCILVEGGTISTLDATTFCVNDFVSDIVNVTVNGFTGTDYSYIITSLDTNLILAGPTNDPSIDFNAAIPDTCIIWGIAFDIFNVPDNTVANITGCFDFSNGIVITKENCIINGCTDPAACNFNALANFEDGSCEQFDCNGVCGGFGIPGTACDDGDPSTLIDVWDDYCNCVEAAILGCTDYYACNYNPDANFDDGSCSTLDCNGVCDGPNMPGQPCDDGDPNTVGDILTGNCLCVGIPTSCLSEAGTISFTQGGFFADQSFICYEDVTIVDADDFILLPGQSVYYIYHNIGPNLNLGNLPIAPVDIVQMGSFLENDLGKNTIWVTAIAATSDGNFGPDYTDPCLTISNTLVVNLLDPITITTTEECDTENGEFTYSFTIGGGLPECLPSSTYFIDGEFYNGASLYLEEIFVGPILDGATYDINVIDGNGCEATFERTVDCDKLPVELRDLNATAQQSNNKIYWTTSTELNNDYFTVEKSENAIDFVEVAKVEGNLSSNSAINYQILDEAIKAGLTYYKLSSTNLNGIKRKLGITSINRIAIEFELLAIKPIPTSTVLNIELQAEKNNTLQLQIIDIQGKTISTTNRNAIIGYNNLVLDVANYKKGIYFLKIVAENTVKLHKFIVE